MNLSKYFETIYQERPELVSWSDYFKNDKEDISLIINEYYYKKIFNVLKKERNKKKNKKHKKNNNLKEGKDDDNYVWSNNEIHDNNDDDFDKFFEYFKINCFLLNAIKIIRHIKVLLKKKGKENKNWNMKIDNIFLIKYYHWIKGIIINDIINKDN